jgi:hypothetical protein
MFRILGSILREYCPVHSRNHNYDAIANADMVVVRIMAAYCGLYRAPDREILPMACSVCVSCT